MRLTLAVLFAVNVLNFYDRTALNPALDLVRREFGVGDAQLGALGTWFVVVYAVAGLPLGRLADTGSRRRLLAVGVALWTALTAAGALAPSYAVLLLTRLGVGVGEAVCAPAAVSWIGDIVPAARRSRALSIFMMAVPVGLLLSFALSGAVAQQWGWRAALLAAGAPGLLLVPAVLLLPEPVRAGAAAKEARTSELLRIPAFLWIIASGALLNFNLYAVSTFLPALLTRHHGWTVAQAGLWTGVGLGAAGIAGGIVAATFGDRLGGRRGGRLAGAAAAAAAAIPFAAAGILLPRGAVAALPLIVAACGLLNIYYGLAYAAIQDIVAPSLRATAMSIYFLAMYLCGGAFGPLLTGGLSDLLARRAIASGAAAEAARAAGLQHAMLVVPALSAALALVLWAGARAEAKAGPSDRSLVEG